MDTRTKIIIATLAVPSFMTGTDFTGVFMLIGPIGQEFSVDITTSQWVMNIYALGWAMMQVTGGRLGDMFGHRRVVQIGLAVFVVSSLVCTLAPSIGVLIGARAVQGIGAAIAWPCVIGLAMTSIKEEERGFAVGLLLGAVAMGNVVSPFMAGLLAGIGEWRLFFAINVLLAVVSSLLIWRVLGRETFEPAKEKVDYGGMIVLAIAVLALLYALDVGADLGWGSLPILGLFALFIVLSAVFPWLEKRVTDPMVPPTMMRNRQFLMSVACNGLAAPAAFFLFMYFPQYMNKVLGWSIVWASIGMVPMLIVLAIFNVTIGRSYERIGPRRLMVAGYGAIAVGTITVLFLSPNWGYVGLLPAMILIGAGTGIALGPSITATVSAVPASRAGLAGGLAYMSHLGIGAIGIAGATAVIYSASLSALGRGLEQAGITISEADQATLNSGGTTSDSGQSILSGLSAEQVQQVDTVLADAFVTGMHQAFWLALAACLIGILFALQINKEKLAAAAAAESKRAEGG
ncbi:MAG: MFS transporter [Pseudomonadota bacterium]